jgi:hypothetical protein
VHTCNLSYSGGRWRQENLKFKASQGKVSKTLSQKQNTSHRAGSMAQVIKHLFSMCEAMDSIPWYCRNKTKQNKTKTWNFFIK